LIESLSIHGLTRLSKIQKSFLEKVLKSPQMSIRLAGLESLKFKAYQLSDEELLVLTKALVDDFRDPVVIATIKILQRRDGVDICNRIVEIANKGSAPAAHAAVLALGSIGTKHSNKALISLKEALPKGKLRDLTKSNSIINTDSLACPKKTTRRC